MKYDLADIMTGRMLYKESDCEFVFYKEELHIFLPISKDSSFDEFCLKQIENQLVDFPESHYVDVDYLEGCFNNGYKVIFFPHKYSSISISNTEEVINIRAFLLLDPCEKSCDKPICKMDFSSCELDYIFPTFNAINKPVEVSGLGAQISFRPYIKTESIPQKFFDADDKEIEVKFYIQTLLGGRFVNCPVHLHSIMRFSFAPTLDYLFLLQLYFYAQSFVQFLCGRKNVAFKEVNLINSDNYAFGMLFIVNNEIEIDFEALNKNSFISYDYIAGTEGKILSDICKGELCLNHLSTTSAKKHITDASKLVLTAAAFEWEFNRLFPDGIPKDLQTIEIINKVTKIYEQLQSDTVDEVEIKIYQNAIDHVDDDSFKKCFVFATKKLNSLLKKFGSSIYKTNNIKYKLSEIGFRLGEARNKYAHAKMNVNLSSKTLLDVWFLQIVLYTVQLKIYGIEDNKIYKALCALFGTPF